MGLKLLAFGMVLFLVTVARAGGTGRLELSGRVLVTAAVEIDRERGTWRVESTGTVRSRVERKPGSITIQVLAP